MLRNAALLGELESMLFCQAGGGPTPAGAHVRVHRPSCDTKGFAVKPLDFWYDQWQYCWYANEDGSSLGMQSVWARLAIEGREIAGMLREVQESEVGRWG